MNKDVKKKDYSDAESLCKLPSVEKLFEFDFKEGDSKFNAVDVLTWIHCRADKNYHYDTFNTIINK